MIRVKDSDDTILALEQLHTCVALVASKGTLKGITLLTLSKDGIYLYQDAGGFDMAVDKFGKIAIENPTTQPMVTLGEMDLVESVDKIAAMFDFPISANKIRTIKLVRMIDKRIGLAEAKHFVERHWEF